jgi:hypothetical protein
MLLAEAGCIIGVSGNPLQKGLTMRRRFMALSVAIALALGLTLGLIAALGVQSAWHSGNSPVGGWKGSATQPLQPNGSTPLRNQLTHRIVVAGQLIQSPQTGATSNGTVKDINADTIENFF